MSTPSFVKVWQLSLDVDAPTIAACWETLSLDERIRARRFLHPQGKRRFVVARACLRLLLAAMIEVDPADIEFTHNRFGKPYVAGQAKDNGIQFNVTHSNDIALYAIAFGRQVGIDLEHIQCDVDIARIADYAFSDRERRYLARMGGKSYRKGFYQIWVRKEALVKADGRGFHVPLPSLDVGGETAQASRKESEQTILLEDSVWTLRDLDMGVGLASAVAAAGGDWQLDVSSISVPSANLL